jgi:hypothetical protein
MKNDGLLAFVEGGRNPSSLSTTGFKSGLWGAYLILLRATKPYLPTFQPSKHLTSDNGLLEVSGLRRIDFAGGFTSATRTTPPRLPAREPRFVLRLSFTFAFSAFFMTLPTLLGRRS